MAAEQYPRAQLQRALVEIEERCEERTVNEDRYGRRARSPTRIPVSGWRDIAKRVLSEVQEYRLTLIAAGVAF